MWLDRPIKIFDMNGVLTSPEEDRDNFRPKFYHALGKYFEQYISEAYDDAGRDPSVIDRSMRRQHGGLVYGLSVEYGVHPQHFLDQALSFPVADCFSPSSQTVQIIANMPAEKKYVLTNANAALAFPTLERLGLTGLFDGIFTMEDSGYRSKPDPLVYDAFLNRFSVNPQDAVLFDDSPVKLQPAHERGISTVLIEGTQGEWDLPYIDYHFRKLLDLKGSVSTHFSRAANTDSWSPPKVQPSQPTFRTRDFK